MARSYDLGLPKCIGSVQIYSTIGETHQNLPGADSFS